jgi:hypothetical protein
MESNRPFELSHANPNTYCNSVKRSYTVKSRKSKSLNPDWIVGFTDAEGSFWVSMTLRNDTKKPSWRITANFEISLHYCDREKLRKKLSLATHPIQN